MTDMSDDNDDDILDVTIPAGIPGALFVAICEDIQTAYANLVPGNGKRKAKLTAVKVLETLTVFYERIAAEEEEEAE